MIFDKSMDLDIPEMLVLEKELKTLGFKKFKTGRNLFIFKSKNYKKLEITKTVIEEEDIQYYLEDKEADWNLRGMTFFKVVNKNKRGKYTVTNHKKEMYSKYMSNDLRKIKIDNLLK